MFDSNSLAPGKPNTIRGQKIAMEIAPAHAISASSERMARADRRDSPAETYCQRVLSVVGTRSRAPIRVALADRIYTTVPGVA